MKNWPTLNGSDLTVRTTYVGPGMGRSAATGARIIVRGMYGQKTFPYDHAAYDPHTAAAIAYAVANGWPASTKAERINYSRSRTGFLVGLY